MSIIRTSKRRNPYAQIDRQALEDESLSWKAKGLLSYLLSKPDDWHVYVKQLQNAGTDGRDATRSGLKELEAAGYIERSQLHDEDGQFAGYEYVVHERPTDSNTDPEAPPDSSTPSTVNGKPEDGESTVYGKSENGLSENGFSEIGKPATTNKGRGSKKDGSKKEGSNTSHPPNRSNTSARARARGDGEGGGGKDWKQQRLKNAGVMPSQAEAIAGQVNAKLVEKIIRVYRYRRAHGVGDVPQSAGWIVWALNNPDEVDIPAGMTRPDRSWTPEPIDRDEQPSREEVRQLIDDTLNAVRQSSNQPEA